MSSDLVDKVRRGTEIVLLKPKTCHNVGNIPPCYYSEHPFTNFFYLTPVAGFTPPRQYGEMLSAATARASASSTSYA